MLLITSIRPLPLPSKSFPIHHPPINLPSTIFFGDMTTSSTKKRLLGLTTTRWCLSCQSYKQTRDKTAAAAAATTTTTIHQLNLTELRPSKHSVPYFLYMTFHNMVGGTWNSRPDFMLVSSHVLISYYAAWSHMGSFNIKAASLCCTELSLQHTATLESRTSGYALPDCKCG